MLRPSPKHHLSGRASKDKQIERYRAELERLRSVQDELTDGLDISIFVTNPNLEIVYANRAACEAFDFLDPLGRSVLAVTLSNELESIMQQVLEKNEPAMAELVIRHPKERVFIAACWRESSPGGRLFLSLSDITELRRLERVRRDFVANVSHELKTPMATVRAMAESILDQPEGLTDDQKRFLHKIIAEVDRLTNISDDLLTQSLSEAGGLSRTTTNVAEIVRTVANDLKPKAEAKGLEMIIDIPDSLSAVVNPMQMSQIAINLIGNAINYTQKGKISISLKSENDMLALAVTDTGLGITEENQSRIFERFFRVDQGRSRETGGTGLGLSIVRHIAESHGGRAIVESRLNQGSTFTVEIPLHRNV